MNVSSPYKSRQMTFCQQGPAQETILRMKQKNEIQTVILGCTELPLLLNDEVSAVPCLDTMKIHIRALLDKIMSD